VEAQTAIAMTPKAISNLRNRIAHYIRTASRWPTILKHKAKLTGLALDDAIVASRILRSSHG
jgi:hypothetical protein